MTLYGLRILPTWPHPVGKPGDLVGGAWMDTDRDLLEEVRQHSPNAEHYEVVPIGDEDGTT